MEADSVLAVKEVGNLGKEMDQRRNKRSLLEMLRVPDFAIDLPSRIPGQESRFGG